TGSLIGWDVAFSRIGFSIIFATVVGLVIAKILPDKQISTPVDLGKDSSKSNTKGLLLLFGTLITILFVGTRIDEAWLKYSVEIILIGMIGLIVKRYFQKSEFVDWMKETFGFVKTIGPYLIIGVFFSGILIYLLPSEIIGEYVGNNSILALFIPVAFGVVAYFPTLVEVPMANAFLQMGMARGPLMAYLLSDPVISLPSILSVRKLIGNKRILVYAGMIVVLSVVAGYVFGVLSTS
ncbi:MAG: hypothetical protein COY74_08435, partial [Nitrosopumilales archaeon CG_4_10_14_0_8_um_filter_34_8]